MNGVTSVPTNCKGYFLDVENVKRYEKDEEFVKNHLVPEIKLKLEEVAARCKFEYDHERSILGVWDSLPDFKED